MGQGGSATSGRGLTGIQVAAALRVTAAAQLQHHQERQASRGGAAGTSEDTRDTLARLDESAYTESREHQVSAPAASGDGEVTVTVTEYAPEIFRCMRAGDAVSEDTFADEWTLPEERLKMELGEGRSQALFLKSKNMEFMCKTIAKGEVDVLLDILKDYARHTAEQPNSLLMRFYMLLKVEVKSEVGYILCFNDVFGSATVLNEKWDIKGRVPKPGKFHYFPHLVREAYAPDPFLIDTPHDDVVSSSDANAEGDVVMVRAEDDKQRLPTHKDKELTRLFWLDKAQREKVVGQLLADYAFLRGVGLMDYSMLVGVSYNENKTSRSGKRYVVIKNMKISHMVGSDADGGPVEVRPASPRAKRGGQEEGEAADAHTTSSEFANGVHSLFDQEVYFIGVIDMLTKYGAAKKVANFCKSFLWHEDTLSTIPPDEYEKRIARFTKIAFPEVSEGEEEL